jgi:hypothetical protein
MYTVLATIKRDKGGQFVSYLPKKDNLGKFRKVILDPTQVPFKTGRATLCKVSYFYQEGNLFVSHVKKARNLEELVLVFRSRKSTVLVINSFPRQMILFEQKQVKHYLAIKPDPETRFTPNKLIFSESEWKVTTLLDNPSMESWKDILDDFYNYNIAKLIFDKTGWRSNIYNTVINVGIMSVLNRVSKKHVLTCYSPPKVVKKTTVYPELKSSEKWF